MTWRETIKAQSLEATPLLGSFRQARFIVPGSEAVAGRRSEVHEYPQRDLPYVEDLGRAARRFTIEVFVDRRLTSDYTQARDALIAALEDPGPGTLVHPWYGTMQVALAEPANVRESTREGGRAMFRLVFVEAGEHRFPNSGSDTVWAVESGVDAALTSVRDSFVARFAPDGLPEWTLTELQEDVAHTLAELEALIGDIAGPVAAEIRAPANMIAALIGGIQQIGETATEPLRALGLYRRLFSAGDDSPAVPATTATRRRQAQLADTLHRAVQQAAVLEAARASSQAAYASQADAIATAEDLRDALDTQLEAADPITGAPIDDVLYQALAAVQAAVVRDLNTRGARLPELATHTPSATLPALVIAHTLYGDANRADELIARNNIRHPGFVPGGVALEVLHD